jgi:hemerythrin-like metal-binding protein
MKKREPLSKNLKTIGGRMKLYRERVAHCKGTAMAALLGISGGTYSDLENNKKKPSAKVITSYCSQPIMDIPWLLTGEIKTKAAKKIHSYVTCNFDDEAEEEGVETIEGLFLTKNDMIGNVEIDSGHKYLASLINTIEAAINSKLGAGVVLNHVAELYTFAKAIFKREEEIQRNIKFKNRTKHKEMHKTLIDEIQSRHEELESAKEDKYQQVYQGVLISTLTRWLSRHIEEDLKMKEYFEE